MCRMRELISVSLAFREGAKTIANDIPAKMGSARIKLPSHLSLVFSIKFTVHIRNKF